MIAVLEYLALYLLALLPGLPLGFALFGRRHAAGWASGALFGYALTALAIWAPIRLGVPFGVAFIAAWLIVAVVAWLLVRGLPQPLVPLPPWRTRDTRALLAVLALTLAIAIPPFMRAGAVDEAGNRRYRAYFTADFVWHTALVSELAKFSAPPRNPYLSPKPIHYYWTYFLLPAAAAGTAPHGAENVETFLKVNATATAVLFVAMIFVCAWAAIPRAWPVAAAVALAIAASSAEGSFALWRFWQRGVPLGEVRNLNIDAITNWWFHGLRLDGLQRCFWWVPQHSTAYALGLIALTVAHAAGSGAPLGAIVLAGVALAGATMMNPFVGGVFALVWGAAVAIDAARSGAFVSRLLRHAIAIVPVALALGWVIGNRMAEGGGSALQFGWLIGEAHNSPVMTLLLALGPILLATLAGVAVPRAAMASSRPVAAAVLAVIALMLLFCARLNVDPAWIAFRSGQLFLVAVPALIARGLAARAPWRRVAVAAAVAALAVGLPTTAIDVYNAQDVTNVSESPIGPWTIVISADQEEGLAWLRRATPATAVVQMEPMVRGRSAWSLIPSFAERRMAAGQPISLLGGTTDGTEYAEKSARVRAMFEGASAAQAAEIARALRIDYVWVDATDRAAYPAGVAKFEAAPQFFAPVFKKGDVSIYRVP